MAGINGCTKDSNAPALTPYEKGDLILAKYLDLPQTPFEYEQIQIPNHLNFEIISTQDNTPENNPITNAGATLGRVLFYDAQLSINNTISCSSCHIQANGFSDTLALSIGFEGGKTGRHSMGLSNATFRSNGKFFWDERASSLEEQVLMPIQDPIEMGMSLKELTLKLQSTPYYPVLFSKAFGDNEVTSERISKSLSQFIRSMLSFNSKFDQGRIQHEITEPFDNFSEQENFGKELFQSINKGMCASCHFTDAMITDVARNNGLSREYGDIGVENATANPLDKYKFRAPSLRNIGVRAPYMHDGSYNTLGDVIQAYSTGITWAPTLDAHLMLPGNTAAIRFNLTREEQLALEAFLHTLTDEEFLTNEIYSDPFK